MCLDALYHISRGTLSVVMFNLLLPYVLLVSVVVSCTQCLCGESIKWSHRVKTEDVFGIWYGVGYAQHTPDRSNIPNEIGCIYLNVKHINEFDDNPFDWSIQRSNYSSQSYSPSNRNYWSGNSLPGSWSDFRSKGKVKRNVDGEKRVRVLWNKDGYTMEQVYIYYEEEPGLWTAEQLTPLEKELISKGIDVWYPDDLPRHPDVIRLIEVTPYTLILNHCTDLGNGGIISLILRRSPSTVNRWELYQYQQQFYKYDLPNVYRFSAICAACNVISSFVIVVVFSISLCILL